VQARHRIAVWLAWFAVLNVVWLILVATLNWQEEVVGVIAAAIGATAAEAVQAQGLIRLRVTGQVVGGTWRLPWQVIVETWMVFAALWRHVARREPVHGGFHCVPFEHRGDPLEEEARRALYKIEASVAPNTYVVGYDEETRSMLLHELVSTGKRRA
jgi:multisubunit Na+/H+ antiporter MnhE subunit